MKRKPYQPPRIVEETTTKDYAPGDYETVVRVDPNSNCHGVSVEHGIPGQPVNSLEDAREICKQIGLQRIVILPYYFREEAERLAMRWAEDFQKDGGCLSTMHFEQLVDVVHYALAARRRVGDQIVPKGEPKR